jgi:glycosyltransferase 2 family protein
LSALATSTLPEVVSRRRRVWMNVARLGVLGILVWVLATRLAWHDVLGAFSGMHWWYMVPVVVILTPASVLIRSLRWRALLPGGESISLRNYIRAYLVGFLSNAVLVGKLGDVVKARALCEGDLSMGTSLGSALLDRVVEGATLLIVVTFALITSPGLPRWTFEVVSVAGALTALAFCIIYGAINNRAQLARWEERLLSVTPESIQKRLQGQMGKLVDGFSGVQQRRLARAVCWSLLVWIVEVLAVAAFLKAFSIGAPLLLAAVVVLLALNFGTLLPISPGSIGIYQVLCALSLSIWGVQRELSFSFGLAMQAVLFLPVYAAGAFCVLSWPNSKN